MSWNDAWNDVYKAAEFRERITSPHRSYPQVDPPSEPHGIPEALDTLFQLVGTLKFRECHGTCHSFCKVDYDLQTAPSKISSSGYAFFPWPAYRKSLYTPLKGVPSCDRRISKLFVRPGMLEKTLSNVFTYLPTCCPKDVCLMSPFWLRQEKVWPDGSPGLPKDLCSFCHVSSSASKFFMLALLSFWRFFV